MSFNSKGYQINDFSDNELLNLHPNVDLETFKEVMLRQDPKISEDVLGIALCNNIKIDRLDITELLLNNGADVNYLSGAPMSSLAQFDWREATGTTEEIRDKTTSSKMFDLLLSHGANDFNDAMIVAVDHQNVGFIGNLINNNIDLSNDNYKILTHAAAIGEVDIVENIINCEIPDQKAINNAFFEASIYGQTETVDYLIEKIDKNDLVLKDAVLDNCVFHQENNMIERLNEKHGYSIDRTSNNHIHNAISYGNDKALEYFIKTEPNLLNIIKDPVISNRLIMDKPEAFMVINTALKAQLNKKDPSPTPTGMNIQNKIDKPLTL